MYLRKTSVSMCCGNVTKNRKHKVCLANFRILLILNHVSEYA